MIPAFALPELHETLPIYYIPSQALWRAFELRALRNIKFKGPILEIGCGDGDFTKLFLTSVDTAIDINPRSIQRNSLRENADKVYSEVFQMDARKLAFQDNSFYSILANCVIEHIPRVDEVLNESFRVLKPGGKFFATVPLKSMNNHLLLSKTWYMNLRAKQLSHVNLWGEEKWKEELIRAGFKKIEITSYLPASACSVWDQIDAFFCIGSNRFNFGSLAMKFKGTVSPEFLKKAADLITRKVAQENFTRGDESCAVLIEATK